MSGVTLSRLLGTLKNTLRIKLLTFDASALTAARTATLPDKSGTVAFTSDFANIAKRHVSFTLGNGQDVITTGEQNTARVRMPCNGIITGWTALSLDDTVGSIVCDIWRDSYANYPPTVADTITASAKPSLSSATKATSTTLTGWTTAFSEGDMMGINVDSISSLKAVALILHYTAS